MRSAALLLLALLLACSPQEHVEIGAALALTGEAAQLGQDELRAIELAIAEANAEGGVLGRQLSLIVEDTKTSSTGTLSAVRKLIEIDEVPAIIGPTYGDSFAEIAAPVGEKRKVVQITPSGALETVVNAESYTYYFSTWYPQDEEIAAQMRFLGSKGVERVVVIHDQDAFNTGYADRFIAQTLRSGLEVARLEIPIGTTDFRTPLIRAQARDPQAILALIYDTSQLAQLARNTQELGIEAIILSTASTQTQALLEQSASLEGNLYYTYPDIAGERYREFEERFEERYGAKPIGASAGPAYDAARAIIAAMGDGARTGEQIRDALGRLEMEGTITESLEFTPRGQIAQAAFVIKTVRDGAFVEDE